MKYLFRLSINFVSLKQQKDKIHSFVLLNESNNQLDLFHFQFLKVFEMLNQDYNKFHKDFEL